MPGVPHDAGETQSIPLELWTCPNGQWHTAWQVPSSEGQLEPWQIGQRILLASQHCPTSETHILGFKGHCIAPDQQLSWQEFPLQKLYVPLV